DGELALPFLPHGGAVGVEFSADGRFLLTTGNGVRLWDLASTRRPLLSFLRASRGEMSDLKASPDGRDVASLDPEGRIRPWSTGTGEALSPGWRVPGRWREVLPGPGGRTLVTVGWGEGSSAAPSEEEVKGRMCGSRGTYVWTEPRDVQVWDAATGKPLTPP